MTLTDFQQTLNALNSLEMNSFSSDDTVLLVVDMINGFVYEGALSSPRIVNIIPTVSSLMKSAENSNIKVIAFSDCHSENAVEFNSFPPHCIKNTSEPNIIDDLKDICSFTTIEKNSTNGFHAPDFQALLNQNPNWKNFIICGDCTDICVSNLCITLKTFFDQNNKECRVIVPVNAVETYDIPKVHNAEISNLASLMVMATNGIELVKEIF